MFKSYNVQTIETPHSKARFGTFPAAARLKMSGGNDPAMIDYITHFYDQLTPGQPGYWTTLSGVAWILGKYWDKFSPAQRDHLKTKLKGLSNLTEHGTENHAINKVVAAYLFSQYWPNETGWGNGKYTSAQLESMARENMMRVMRSLYDKGLNEDLSTTYIAVHLYPYFVLFDCAKDAQVKAAANAALTFHVAHIAANHYEGVVVPPFNRENAPQRNVSTAGIALVPALQWIHWFYWGESVNRTPVTEDFISRAENRWVIQAALSDWAIPPAISSLGFGKTAPYELTSTASKFGNWGTGGPAGLVRYVYRDNLYAIGSGNSQFRPNGYFVDLSMFGIIYESSDNFNYIDIHHHYWRSNERVWRGASPFVQMAQSKDTAIVLFNIPAEDPWFDRGIYLKYRDKHLNGLIQEALVRFPRSIDQIAESSGWIFLREGSVYIAIRPLAPYTIDGSYYTQMTPYPSGSAENYMNQFRDVTASFNVVRSAAPKTGFVFDMSSKDAFTTFEAFQAAVKQRQLKVDLNNLSVTYTNLKGNTLTAAWKAPNYNVPNFTDVWIAPTFSVNGSDVPIDNDFVTGKAVIKSPTIQLIDRILRVETPTGSLSVDWRESLPVSSGK
jgi:hypothetical protein